MHRRGGASQGRPRSPTGCVQEPPPRPWPREARVVTQPALLRAVLEGFDDAGEDPVRPSEVPRPDPVAERVRPFALGGPDPPQGRASAGRQPDELGAPVRRILLVGDEAVALEQVSHALNALPGKRPRACALGDGHRPMLDGRENAPARSRLTGRFGEFVTGGLQDAVEAKYVHDELTERIACSR